MGQNNISEIQQDKDLFFVRITRRNGTSYRVTSEDYESVQEYRNEFLGTAKQRSR